MGAIRARDDGFVMNESANRVRPVLGNMTLIPVVNRSYLPLYCQQWPVYPCLYVI